MSQSSIFVESPEGKFSQLTPDKISMVSSCENSTVFLTFSNNPVFWGQIFWQ
jgi:hypothetical protein